MRLLPLHVYHDACSKEMVEAAQLQLSYDTSNTLYWYSLYILYSFFIPLIRSGQLKFCVVLYCCTVLYFEVYVRVVSNERLLRAYKYADSRQNVCEC